MAHFKYRRPRDVKEKQVTGGIGVVQSVGKSSIDKFLVESQRPICCAMLDELP